MAGTTSDSPLNTPPEQTYTELRHELDAILGKLQSPDSDIDEAVGLFEQALTIIGKLEQQLDAAENRITAIKTSFDIPAEDA
jgi:exodeoxyribonuclease VII small subunit